MLGREGGKGGGGRGSLVLLPIDQERVMVGIHATVRSVVKRCLASETGACGLVLCSKFWIVP